MVRRARVPRDSSNRILYGGFSHRELSGWPDGVVHNGRAKKKRKPKKKEPKEVDVTTLPAFVPVAVKFGEPL